MQPELKNYRGEMKPWTWSPSKLVTWDEGCHYAFFRDHILHEDSFTKNNAFALGTGVHAALEQISIDYADGLLDPCGYRAYTDLAFRTTKADDRRCEADFVRFNQNPPEVDASAMIQHYLDRGKFIKPLKANPQDWNAPSENIGGKWVKKRYWSEFFGNIVVPDTALGGVIKITLKADGISENYEGYDWKTSSAKYRYDDIKNPIAGKGLQITSLGVWTYSTFGKLTKNGWVVLVKPNEKKGIKFDVQPIFFQMTEDIITEFYKKIVKINKEFMIELSGYINEGKDFKRCGDGRTGKCYMCKKNYLCR